MQIRFIKKLILVIAVMIAGLSVWQTAVAQNNIETRIIGGTQTSSSSTWPWMVMLSKTDSTSDFFCGASLISEQWILTAAHCVDGKTKREVRAFVGLYDKSSPAEPAVAISKIVIHPEYDPNTSDNDIALLKLSSSATGKQILSFADVTTAASLMAGDDVSVIGWGDTTVDPDLVSYPNILRDVVMPYVSNTVCNSTMNGQVTDNMMCAGLALGGVDSCQGDSGGPLVFSIDDGIGGVTWHQAGIVSWGYGCAEPGQYGVYTRVEKYSEWLALMVNGITITPSVKMGTWVTGLKATYDLTIENDPANPAFDITNLSLSTTDFSVIDKTCTTTVSAGEACSLQLTFPANFTGSYFDSLVIERDSGSLPDIAIPVSATVVDLASFNQVQADSSIQWALAGAKDWSEQQVTTVSGVFSFQSGNVVNNQSSSLFAYVNIAPGNASRTVYFDWRACSEPDFDFLELWVDNVKVDALSGNVDWVSNSVLLDGEGDHVIEWRYNKDYVYSFGNDAGWLDNIMLDFETTNPLPVHIGQCDLSINDSPDDDPLPAVSTTLVHKGGGAVSPWFYLGLGLPLFMRRHMKVSIKDS